MAIQNDADYLAALEEKKGYQDLLDSLTEEQKNSNLSALQGLLKANDNLATEIKEYEKRRALTKKLARVKAELASESDKAAAEDAKAVAKKAKAEADILKADAQKAKADVKKAKAEADILKADAQKAKADATIVAAKAKKIAAVKKAETDQAKIDKLEAAEQAEAAKQAAYKDIIDSAYAPRDVRRELKNEERRKAKEEKTARKATQQYQKEAAKSQKKWEKEWSKATGVKIRHSSKLGSKVNALTGKVRAATGIAKLETKEMFGSLLGKSKIATPLGPVIAAFTTLTAVVKTVSASLKELQSHAKGLMDAFAAGQQGIGDYATSAGKLQSAENKEKNAWASFRLSVGTAFASWSAFFKKISAGLAKLVTIKEDENAAERVAIAEAEAAAKQQFATTGYVGGAATTRAGAMTEYASQYLKKTAALSGITDYEIDAEELKSTVDSLTKLVTTGGVLGFLNTSDSALAGYAYSKGIDIVNVERSAAALSELRSEYLELQIETMNKGVDALLDMLAIDQQNGNILKKMSQQLFSFDEVISLRAYDPSTTNLIAVGSSKEGQTIDELRNKLEELGISAEDLSDKELFELALQTGLVDTSFEGLYNNAVALGAKFDDVDIARLKQLYEGSGSPLEKFKKFLETGGVGYESLWDTAGNSLSTAFAELPAFGTNIKDWAEALGSVDPLSFTDAVNDFIASLKLFPYSASATRKPTSSADITSVDVTSWPANPAELGPNNLAEFDPVLTKIDPRSIGKPLPTLSNLGNDADKSLFSLIQSGKLTTDMLDLPIIGNANGGVGTVPALSTLFEHGAEAVIPLESDAGIKYLANAMAMAGGGNSDEINVYLNLDGINIADDERHWNQVAEKIGERIAIQTQRRGGYYG